MQKNRFNWVVPVYKTDLDLRQLLYQGDSKLTSTVFGSFVDVRKNRGLMNVQRVILAKKIRLFILARIATGAARLSITGPYGRMKQFITYIDNRNISIDKISIIYALTQYSNQLKNQVLSGHYKPETAYWKLYAAVLATSLYTDRLIKELYVHCAKIALKSHSGRQSKYVSTLDIIAFKNFISDMKKQLTYEVISSPPTKQKIIYHKEKPIVIKLFSCQTLKMFTRRNIPHTITNQHLVQYRVIAHFLEFIAITGLNRQVAVDCMVKDISWNVDARGFTLIQFKERRGGSVTARITNRYKQQIMQYLAFLKSVFKMIPAECALFPRISIDSPAILCNKHDNAITIELSHNKFSQNTEYAIRHIFDENSVCWIGPRQLRSVKADWVLKNNNGNLLKSSRIMGNTPQVFYNSYGGKGNLDIAIKEWSKFWRIDPELKYRSSIAPGKCTSLKDNIFLEDRSKLLDCDSETACLTCKHYRGEESLEYIHMVITWRHFMTMRLKLGSEQYSESINILSEIIEQFSIKNTGSLAAINDLIVNIENGNKWHNRWNRTMKISAIMLGENKNA